VILKGGRSEAIKSIELGRERLSLNKKKSISFEERLWAEGKDIFSLLEGLILVKVTLRDTKIGESEIWGGK